MTAEFDDANTLLNSFVGRTSELAMLHRQLQRRGRQPVFVLGPRGIGKTALIRAYALAKRETYFDVVNVSAAQIQDVNILPAIIAARLGGAFGSNVLRARGDSSGLDFRGIDDIVRQLSGERPLLLILDDADALQVHGFERLVELSQTLPDQIRLVVLATALPERYAMKFRHRSIELGVLSARDLNDLIERRFIQHGATSQLTQRAFASVAAAGADLAAATPRFVITLLNAMYEAGDFNRAFADAIVPYLHDASNFIIVPVGERLRVLPVAAFEPTEIITPTSRSFVAAPFIIVPNVARFWRAKLEEFEELINPKRPRERDIQRFLEKNPRVLCGVDYEKIIAHPVLHREDDGDLIPDFFLKPVSSELVDILDLKLPNESLVVGARDRKHLSSAVTGAIAQVREYRDYFENSAHRDAVRERYGVTGYRPKTVVVIGRTPTDVPEEQMRQIVEDSPRHVSIVTYDDLIARIRVLAHTFGQ